jgi:formyltetrahydrofolate-dependent phosphoribosylglycinamide formyltransferase
MLKKLQQRWKVNTLNLLLIICTFALGGSLCGLAGKKILQLTGIEKGVEWGLVYIIVITLLWPVCVLLISIPLGQFSFFKNYLHKIWKRMTNKQPKPVSIAIFASGAGSNAQKIIDKFKTGDSAIISLVVCNNPNAGVLGIAAKEAIPSLLIEKKRFLEGDHYLDEFQKKNIDVIILAGFLWKIPSALINAYPEKIINIHPALLPKYGGRGMYGNRVHQAVIDAKEKESGITIHYVDEIYDHGKIILQATCPVDEADTADTLAAKVHALEHLHYPAVIEGWVKNKNRS